MAKQEKELTVEERLKLLYNLQTILSKIDRIKQLRGELPREVEDLENEIAGLQTRVGKFEAEIEAAGMDIQQQQQAREQAIQLIDKFSHDQDNVRNSREYDYLSKEIEYQHLNIELAEKRIDEGERRIQAIQAEIERTRTTIEDQEHVLEQKKSELTEIVSETKQNEEKLRDKAKRLENKIVDQRLLNAFKRIRQNARNGLGIVYVQRNACGGCYNRIPAQRQMEIKMRKKIIVCEYCGRILIDPALAGISETAAKNK